MRASWPPRKIHGVTPCFSFPAGRLPATILTMKILIDIVGWIGAVLVLGAYWLTSTGRVPVRSGVYQWMNVFGSLGMGCNCILQRAWPSFAVNAIWLGIASVTLWQFRRQAAPHMDG